MTALKTIVIKSIFSILLVLITWSPAAAQSPYYLKGNATQDDCHCYTLTKELEFQSASIWNKNKIDLTQPFDYSFNIYAGCLDSTGADGMAFVLQPFDTSIGVQGAGLGFQNIYPSLGVTIDTYQNTEQDDPYYDHISVQANGDTYHKSLNNLAGPVRVLANSDNIEDCKWHKLQIEWEPLNNSLQISVDGNLRLSLQKDIVSSVFNNNPFVFWGFSAATGYLGNMQRVCTSLDAGFILPNKNTCVQAPIVFSDTSNSFSHISNWYWDFGDKTTSNEQNPMHTYDLPGNYMVMLNVLGGEGCLSDTVKQQLTVGSRPVADFKVDTLTPCSGKEIKFSDAANVAVGEKIYWYWDLGNGKISNEQKPSANYNAGKYTVDFFVKTKEGCASDTIRKIITIRQSPSVGFAKEDICIGSPAHFNAKNFTDTIAIEQWYWNFDDNGFAYDPNISHSYLKSGSYLVKLAARAKNECLSDTVVQSVTVYETRAYAGADTTILQGHPYQLKASGGEIYSWYPATGLSNSFVPDPIAILYSDVTYLLTASTLKGCATTDSVHIKVVKEPKIFVPSAFTPNDDGRNDRFRFISTGISEISFFQITNRWGRVIYLSTNAGDGWDGTLNGVPQPAGTYVWMVEGKAIDGSIIKKQGTVVLIR